MLAWLQNMGHAASHGIPPVTTAPDTHDDLRKRHKRYDDTAQTQVIRESRLKPKKAKSAEPALAPIVEPANAALYLDSPQDEEALMALIQRQDDEILAQIDLATHLLRTLH